MTHKLLAIEIAGGELIVAIPLAMALILFGYMSWLARGMAFKVNWRRMRAPLIAITVSLGSLSVVAAMNGHWLSALFVILGLVIAIGIGIQFDRIHSQ